MRYGLTLALACAILGVGSSVAVAGDTLVDMRIGTSVPVEGNGIFNQDGTQQTVTQGVDRGDIGDWGVQIDSESGSVISALMEGCSGNKRFRVTYIGVGGTDITEHVTSGTLSILLGPGQEYQIELRIKPKRKADKGDRFECAITGDTSPGSIPDTVVARAKVT